MSTMSVPRLLSRPVGVEWMGWKTDTQRLQRTGWQLSVEHVPDYHAADRDSYRLAMKHQQMRLYAISNRIVMQRTYFREPWHMSEIPAFIVQHVVSEIAVHEICDSLSMFEPIDGRPQVVNTPLRNIEDFNIFAPLGKMEQVLVDKANMSVVEHLEAIKKLQSEKQRELREKERARPQVIAQLVSYEEVA